MSRPSRPGVLSTIWKHLVNSLTKKPATKVYIEEDTFGHKYYEYQNTSRASTHKNLNVNRGYDPSSNPNAPQPSVEWQSWIKGTRRFPPSDQEIMLNRMKAQSQLSEDATTEKRAPEIKSHGRGAADIDRPRSYLKYDDVEITPGVKKTEEFKPQ